MYPIYGASFSIARILWLSTQEVKMGAVMLTIIPCEPLAKILFLVPANFYSSGREVLVSMDGMLPSRDTQ